MKNEINAQRAQLEKLAKNPAKALQELENARAVVERAHQVETVAEKVYKPPPPTFVDFMRNRPSTASAEFHEYKKIMRKEMDRKERLASEEKAEQEAEEFDEKTKSWRERDEKRTQRNREKRKKRKLGKNGKDKMNKETDIQDVEIVSTEADDIEVPGSIKEIPSKEEIFQDHSSDGRGKPSIAEAVEKIPISTEKEETEADFEQRASSLTPAVKIVDDFF